MPAYLITLPHFSVSSAMSLPKSAGVIGIGTEPSSAIRAAPAALLSRCRCSGGFLYTFVRMKTLATKMFTIIGSWSDGFSSSVSLRGGQLAYPRAGFFIILLQKPNTRAKALFAVVPKKRGGSATGYSSLVSLYPFPSNPRFSSLTSSRGEDTPHTAQRRAPLRHRCLSRVLYRRSKRTCG